VSATQTDSTPAPAPAVDGAAMTAPGTHLPRQLAPYAEPGALRTAWPLLLDSGGSATPLADALHQLVAAIGGPRLLVDNLVRLERWIRAAMSESADAVAADAVVRAAGEGMAAALSLSAEPAAELAAALDSLVAALPDDSSLLPYTRQAALQLLARQADPWCRAARRAWRDDARKIIAELSALLEVERAKDPEAARASEVARSVGGVSSAFLDADALARVVGPRRGGQRMAPARRERLQQLLDRLQATLDAPPTPTLIAVGTKFSGTSWTSQDSADPCRDALARFDALAAELVGVVGALRAARLELAGAYDPAVHDVEVASLDWLHLSPAELALMPVIVAVDDADRIAADGMAALTGLLASGRPVQVLVDLQATRNPGAIPDHLAGFRVELGQLGMSLRQVFVQQTTPALADHCGTGFDKALHAGRAGLHLLCTGWLPGGEAPAIDPWLAASSAVESRAHPLFQYDPDAGESWADCLDASANPQPEADWPAAESDDGNGGAVAAYTFADHALLDPDLGAHFRAPAADDAEHLLPIDAWLALDPVDAARMLPTVVAHARGRDEILVVSESLAFAARDRLRSWRSLRELAGYSNEHARRAAEAARAQALAEAAAERDALVAAHAAELEEVRQTEASAAMERLTAVLMGADFGTLLPAAAPAAVAAAAPADAAPAAPAAATAEEAPAPDAPAAPAEAADEEEEPWIDSALCTSCNDCVNLNGLLFVYDGNKQAMIGDASAGTYEQLVRAAEGCPARCIHPGTPLDPSEPGLDDLVKRAARFR